MFVYISNMAGLKVVLLPKFFVLIKKTINLVWKVASSPRGFKGYLGLCF
jgi:hypothetical protein